MTASLASLAPVPPAPGTTPANGGGVDNASPGAFSRQLAQQRAQQPDQQRAKDNAPGDSAAQPPATGPRDAVRRNGQGGATNGPAARSAPSQATAADSRARAGAEASASPGDATAAEVAADRDATDRDTTDEAAGQPLSINELLWLLQGAESAPDRAAATGLMPARAFTPGQAVESTAVAAVADATDTAQAAPGLAALQAGGADASASGATGDGGSEQPHGGTSRAADAAGSLGGAGRTASGAALAAAVADAAAGTSTTALQAGAELSQGERAPTATATAAAAAAGQVGLPGTTGTVPATPLLTPPAAGSTASLPEARLAASPGHADFAPQLGAQISVFVREGLQQARLQLNPAEMGPITVQIRLDGGNAQVHLAAEHAATRQALEQAMPTLAGSLRDSGLTLTGGGVFEQPRQPGSDSQDPSRQGTRSNPAASPDIGDGPALPAALPSLTPRRGVVDLVA